MTQIRKGNGGTVLLTVSGNQIRKGSGGTVLLTVSGNQIRKGNGGTVLLTVSGNQIRKGSGGTTLYTNSGNLSNAELGAVLYALGEIPNSGSKSFGKKGCFIATATMGNYGHPTVIKLSKFRDEYLVNYNWGRKFIRTYNTLSPYPAKIISKSYILKKVCYFTIIKPLLLIATFIMKSKL